MRWEERRPGWAVSGALGALGQELPMKESRGKATATVARRQPAVHTCSEPQFPYWQRVDKNSYLVRVLYGLKWELVGPDSGVQRLKSRCSINPVILGSCYH